MIITTKGTKTDEAAQDEGQGQSRHPSEVKSRLPYYLALAVASVAAYLKSLFHEPARAEPESEGAGGEPPGASSPKPTILLVSDNRQDEELPDPRARGSSAFVEEAKVVAAASEFEAQEFEAQEFVRVHSLRFAAPEARPDLGDFKPSPVIPNPINDNRGVAPAGGGGGGGGGGHGGGGRGTPSLEDVGSRPHPQGGELAPTQDKTGEGPLDPDGLAGDGGKPGGRPGAGESPADPRGDGGGAKPDGRTEDGDGGGGSTRTDPAGPGETTGGRRNRAPVSTGTVQLADTTRCASLAIAALDLLRGVSDPDGDALSIRGVTTSSGTLVRDGDGWLFEADTVGLVTLTYEVTDGEFAITQTARVNVLDRARDPGPGGDGGIQGGTTGTNGDDLILGTPFPDRIDGGSGNDNIDARGGDDLIDGGPGDDHIIGGAGNDTIVGGLGHDVIFAGAGRDVVSGGAGNDRIFGEDGDDTLFGDEGDDLLDGGAGSDILAGGTGDDTIDGGDGDDRIDGGDGSDLALAGSGRDVVSGGAGDDRLEGGEGDDLLADGTGRDVVFGQEGDDVLVASLDGEGDAFEGGAGVDTLDLSASTAGVVVDLTAGTAHGVETGLDRVASVEVVKGGSGDDTLIGDTGSNALHGGDGRDHLAGGAGDDLIDGGAGGDTLADGTGTDAVLGGDGNDLMLVATDGEDDVFDGGSGMDTLDLTGTRLGVSVDLGGGTATGAETGRDALRAIEVVLAGSGEDRLVGSTGSDKLHGGDGDDHLAGLQGDDVLEGGSGRDEIRDGSGRDVVRGGGGDDLIVLAMDGDDDRVDGGEGSDTLDLGDAKGDLLVDLVRHVVSGTELGDDQIEAVERIVAGAGRDHFVIGDDDVVLTGGDGDDRYEFASHGGDREPTRAVQITDFSVGDHIDLLKWTFFEDAPGSKGESLAEAMERKDGTVSGIRYKSAHLDDGDVTIITADLDHDDLFETTIVLDGQHTLLFLAAAPAAATTPVTTLT